VMTILRCEVVLGRDRRDVSEGDRGDHNGIFYEV
jgi:hypothetical protein